MSYLRYGFGVKWVLFAVSSICPKQPVHSEVKYPVTRALRDHLSPLCTIFTKCQFQLLAIAYVFLSACDIKTSNFLFLGGWGGDISVLTVEAFL